jgi:hypothetical protein
MATVGLIGWLSLRGLVAQRLSLVLLVIAIAIGVGFQIPNTANLAGASAMLLDEELTWGAGDVRVEPRGRPRFAANDGIGVRIERAVPGARAVPVIGLPGGIAASGSRFLGVVVLGIDFTAAPLRIASGAAPARGDLGSCSARPSRAGCMRRSAIPSSCAWCSATPAPRSMTVAPTR